MGVASLVLGIVGLVLSFVPCVGWIALALTIPGIILGACGIASANKHEGKGKGVSIGGLVCSLLATIFAVLWISLMAKGASVVGDAIKEANESAKKHQSTVESKRSSVAGDDANLPESVRNFKRAGDEKIKEMDRKMKEMDADAKKIQQGLDILKELSK